MLRFVRLLAFMCAAVGSIAPARAQPSSPVQRVAVIRLTYQGEIPAGHKETFAARTVEGLAVAAFQVQSGAAVDRKLAADANLRDCSDGDCYPKVADALNVGYLVAGMISESNKNYEIALEIINGRTGSSIGSSRERCETCGVAEAAEKVGLAASALRKRLEALALTPSRVVVRSRPGGATATVDGKMVGKTPTDLELTGGLHHLTLQSEGYNNVERSFTVVSGVDETLNLEMLKPPSQFHYRAWGWTAVAAGAAFMAAAIYAGSIDGKVIVCAPAAKDSNGLCPAVRDTDALALSLMGVGALSAAIGGVWIWTASQQSPAQSASALPDIRNFGVGYRGTL